MWQSAHVIPAMLEVIVVEVPPQPAFISACGWWITAVGPGTASGTSMVWHSAHNSSFGRRSWASLYFSWGSWQSAQSTGLGVVQGSDVPSSSLMKASRTWHGWQRVFVATIPPAARRLLLWADSFQPA